MEWTQEEIKFLENNEHLLEISDFNGFYLKAYTGLGRRTSRHLMAGVVLAVDSSKLDFIVEVDKLGAGVIDYTLYIKGVDLSGDIDLCSGRISGNPDDFTILNNCKVNLRNSKFGEPIIRKILNRAKFGG